MTTDRGVETARADGSGAMFDGIAERYDFVNRVISLGIDRRWRKAAALALELGPSGRVLDLATGTGDLAIEIAQRAPGAHILGIDPSERMLAIARTKVQAKGLADRVELSLGDAQALAAPSASFDGVSIAFGIRNVPDRAKALREMARVTRPGGRIVILELSEPDGVLGPLARFHVHTVVPALGALLSGAPEYRYLQHSIAKFPRAEAFASLLSDSGIEPIAVRPLTFGVCHLYVGTPRAAS
ncbi:MAG TPA: bifunctional demethylmenaquinone methyltransferase/2-methoxy-6-polyprenyl-1,4-benzoquinol methylase UbiE [Polyangiaceae bacterium]